MPWKTPFKSTFFNYISISLCKAFNFEYWRASSEAFLNYPSFGSALTPSKTKIAITGGLLNLTLNLEPFKTKSITPFKFF